MQQPQLYPVNKMDLPPYPGPPVDKGEVLTRTLPFHHIAFASALGKFASLCRSNALRSNPSQTLDDMAQLENRSHAWPT